MNGIRFAFAFAAMIATVHCVSAAELSITLATTPSVEATGLLANILPRFTAKSGITVKVVAQATGRALDTARRGDADVVLVHDPAAEREFIDEGYGATRRQVAWNDFVLVGPSSDPARIVGGKDASAALKAIATARARFVTRGDRSDVNIAELRLWRLAGRTSEALTPEKWYRSVSGDMSQALNAASTTGAYTLSDRATWLAFANKGPLVIAVEGDPRLLSRYDVIELNPKKHGKARLPEAKALADWLVSPEGQHAIEGYRANGEQPFNASAAAPK
ncbi:MAG: substrate-binding domain-containing protein [Bradyrhizobium sp.]|nr:substrate-binding domain-containing protein [Bradyrhizobium sp.]MDE2244390.1 substrate-binding domain-containing protein [Bradyrhizobium sp.]MDE2472053.1 substrate-binding domain-containing protein [Bradyrhizobium sp.]